LENSKSQDLILIIDALNLFTQHYVAHPAISTNGEHVGGIVGFLYSVINFVEEYNPTKVIIVWEGGGSSRRRAIYKEYKQKRRPEKLNRYYENDLPDSVQNRNHQLRVLVEIFKNLPICQIYVSDCEADDVIGFLCRNTLRKNRKLIMSSDKDFYQLLDKKTIIYSPTWKKIVTSKEVKEKFNISPTNFCLAKSICGDSSDNIKGVKGVGFKTLAKRFPQIKESSDITIQEIISVSNINLNEGSKIKAYKSIADSEDIIRRNWKLIYLDIRNLSPFQIDKIRETVDTFKPVRNKMNVMRILLKTGIQTFNVDRLFHSTNYIK
jgi:5'-3' exonuclease